MLHNSHTAQPSSDSPLPTTVWLPGPHDLATAPDAPAVLPGWALDKIRTEFPVPGQQPGTLVRLFIGDTGCGMDARTPRTTHPAHEVEPPGTRPGILLAELHPDTLPTPSEPLTGSPTTPGAIDDGWPGFFHRAHRYLRDGGTLLIAARQRRDDGYLTDPLGLLIATARTAGFVYLQHLIVVHAHAVDDHLQPAPPPGEPGDLIHSDLLVLTRTACPRQGR